MILIYFLIIFVIDTVANAVKNSVEESKNIANSAADTTKTVVDSAKGRWSWKKTWAFDVVWTNIWLKLSFVNKILQGMFILKC